MLYQRWREIARENRAAIALREVATGRSWTFEQLACEVERRAETIGPVFPQGDNADFIFQVLEAWRSNSVVCPLDAGQSATLTSGALPPGIVHVKTTSATTGAPRHVLFTAEQLAADAKNIVQTMGLRPDWPNLVTISLSHSYGFSNLVLPLLLHGIPLILLPAPLPEALRLGAALAGTVTLAAVPALWRTWLEAKAIPENVRLAISAAAPLPLALEREVFEQCGLKIHNFYGSSECGGIAYDRNAEPRKEENDAGTAMENVSLSVSPDGCLCVRSESVAQGYWPMTEPSLGDGMFRTNDLVEIVNDHVLLKGRASDQINVAGRKVSPEAIERALGEHPLVRECLAFGVPSPGADRGETIVACLPADPRLNATVLRDYLITRLPAWQMPRDWWFVESLASNRRGKLSRADWRRRYLEKNTIKA